MNSSDKLCTSTLPGRCVTWPPRASTLARSVGRPGSWSTEICTAFPFLHNIARESPIFATIKRLPFPHTMAVTAVLPPFPTSEAKMLRSVSRYASRVAPVGSDQTPPSFKILSNRFFCKCFATASPLWESKMPKNATYIKD